ncbi:MAG: glutamate synthase subunit alpha, partial [Ruminococcus sp.]|nr:glutamate synthase subunit alpha [Ruminococcus sp.]
MDNFRKESPYEQQGLYSPRFEHDNCGIGAVVNIKGEQSRYVVDNALIIVEKLEHRAGKDAEGKTGDGVGILIQMPYEFFKSELNSLGFDFGDNGDTGVGMFFFPQNELKCGQAKKLFEMIIKKNGMEFLCWRKVPVCPEILGKKALESMPCIMQAFVKRPESCSKGMDFDRKLFIARREFEQSNEETYVCSLSSRTIVYKGMFLVGQLRQFYKDLQDENFKSAIAMVHSRFSTNTNPSWQKAHPNRFIVHNGEINTIIGNADKMLAREETMTCELLKDDMHRILPAINVNGSDSARLDNALEFMVMSGMPLPL